MNLASSSFQLASDDRRFNYPELVIPCENCHKLNPDDVQICYSCGHKFYDDIKGTPYVIAILNIRAEELADLDVEDLAYAMDLWYFVLPTGQRMTWDA